MRRVEAQREQLGVDPALLLRAFLLRALQLRLDLGDLGREHHHVLDLQIVAALELQQPRVFLAQAILQQGVVAHHHGQILGMGVAAGDLVALAGQRDQRVHARGHHPHLQAGAGDVAALLLQAQHRAGTELAAVAGVLGRAQALGYLGRLDLEVDFVLVGQLHAQIGGATRRAAGRSGGAFGRSGGRLFLRRMFAASGRGRQGQGQRGRGPNAAHRDSPRAPCGLGRL
ncbi:hypothetical protein ASD69_00830 [Lysobacter sp. Root604]|nr:hypothetical protein ASD69_00830 [Lysobacter sp. Root604]